MRSGDPENILNIQIKTEHIIADLDTLKAFCDPLRHAIMRSIAEEPLSIRQIAEQLNKPFTNLYYHINILEKHGLIYLAGQRLISGAVLEKFYHVSAKIFRVQRDLFTFVQADEHKKIELLMDDILDGTRTNIRLALEDNSINPNIEPPHTMSALLMQSIQHISPEDVQHFYQAMMMLLEKFNTYRATSGGSNYQLTIAFHPVNDP